MKKYSSYFYEIVAVLLLAMAGVYGGINLAQAGASTLSNATYVISGNVGNNTTNPTNTTLNSILSNPTDSNLFVAQTSTGPDSDTTTLTNFSPGAVILLAETKGAKKRAADKKAAGQELTPAEKKELETLEGFLKKVIDALVAKARGCVPNPCANSTTAVDCVKKVNDRCTEMRKDSSVPDGEYIACGWTTQPDGDFAGFSRTCTKPAKKK